jgi:xanthine dehydrogenase accessory factor
MYDLTDLVHRNPTATLARVVDVRGFSARFASEAMAFTAYESSGQILDGLAAASIQSAEVPSLLEVSISDSDASDRGLSCGGSARILLQRADSIEDSAWQALALGSPVCLVTSLAQASLGSTESFGPGTVNEAEPLHPGVARLFARGSRTSSVQGDSFASALWPTRHLVIVGDGLIALALATLAGELDWTSQVVGLHPEVVSGLSSTDAVVVLSHDRDVDGPMLSAALAGEAGYIGGLGSRRTQTARRQWLTARAVGGQHRIHGPAGLDIGAFTPFEIAVSIVAEILAVRSGTVAQSLSARPGPIHQDGLNAPPPRF